MLVFIQIFTSFGTTKQVEYLDFSQERLLSIMKNIIKLLLVAGGLCMLVGRAKAQAALNFDGSNDFVEVPNNPALAPTTTQAITFEAWLNPSVTNAGIIAAIYDHTNVAGSNFYILKTADNKIFITGNGTNVLISDAAIPLNTWSHIAIVFKDNDGVDQTKIYINGALIKTGDLNYNPSNGGQTLRLGLESNLPDVFKGSMDEVRIWNIARTATEIQNARNCELLGGETGLQAYYKFNQSSGTSLINSANTSNTGTLNNFALSGSISNWVAPGGVTTGTICAGSAGAALAFDGTNDYVSFSQPFTNATNNLTLETWFKWSGATSPQYQFIAMVGNSTTGYGFQLDAVSGQIGYAISNITGVGCASVSPNVWYHIALVRNSGTWQFYLNGVPVGTTSTANPIAAVGSNIGSLSTASSNFSGTVDEVRIWNVVRTPAQILGTKDCELVGTETGLQAYYRFNQSSGATLTDITSNANNGTLTNFALVGGTSNWVAPGGVTTGTTCTATVTTSKIYDFENLTLGNLNGQDNWATDGAVGINVINASTSGLYTGSKTLGNAANGFVAASRLNNGAWSFPSMTGATQITIEASLRMNYWQVDFQLGQDVNADGNFSNGSYTYDANELGIGFGQRTNNTAVVYKADGTLVTAPLATTSGNWLRFRLVINTAANGGAGSGTLYFRNLTTSATNWTPISGLTNINMGINTSANNRTNLSNLNGMFYQADKDNPSIDDILFEVVSPLQVSISGSPTGCGSTTLTALGGSTYAWSTGATTNEITVSTSGTYTVTVTASSGGTATASLAVTIYTPSTASISGTTTACDQVSLLAGPSGMTNYAWSNGVSTAANTFLASGTYTVTVTDGNGCTASASNVVTVNKATASISGPADGCDIVTLTAPSGMTSYAWTGGSTGATATFTTAGNYTVTVTDANGCTASDNHTVFNVAVSKTYYPDVDGDGYGDSNNPTQSCNPLAGYVLIGLDCDDSNAAINPGARETCDNIDNNCNGILIESDCPGSNAPVAAECSSRSTVVVLTGKVFFNYGSLTNARSASTRSSLTLGQPVVGIVIGETLNLGFGFWTRFLLSPSAPAVEATQGDLPDRVQINWSPDPLSPAPSTYKIYRNGALLATVDNETFAFIDFNVLAGQFYTYEIAGVNQFGEGRRGSSLGFLNPNGVITGQIKSFSGNPVVGATVKLSPTIGGAVSFNGLSTVFTEYSPTFPRAKFTLSCWAKIGNGNPTTQNAGIFDFGSSIGKNWWLHAVTPASGSKGVKFGIGKNPATKTEISYTLPDSVKNNWHYYAATYNGSSLLFYVDGELVGTAVGEIAADSTVLFIGKRSDEGGYLIGKLDELRFYNRQLAQTEIQMTMNQTVSASSEGLTSYWKFDEGTGSKSFDLTSNKVKTYLCGAEWTSDKPTVVNAGISDETGFYKIEGVNYSSGQTFTAVPSKNFYFNQSLEFNAANQSYADLTNFDLPDSTTIDITVKNFDFSATQTLLSKQDGSTTHFSLNLNAGNVVLEMGGSSYDFGAIGMGFYRLTFVMKQTGSSTDVTFYKNGTLVGMHTFSGVAASFVGGTPWTLGAKRNGANTENYFTGLIDEVAFFSTLLSLPEIQTFTNIGTNVKHPNLAQYFNLNEGSSTILHDMGTALTGEGTTHSATWSTVAAISETLPHKFTPSSRLVTLNPSNTSSDQIDFTDQSTIPVSGYVRFDGTDCFQKGVEILVNGAHALPACYTDSLGYFVLDLEPGATVQLTPVLKQHTFYPAFWDLQNLSTPVAGILFRNQTKRSIEGQLAGNIHCRKSIIPTNAAGNVTAVVKVAVETLDGCLYREIQIQQANGKFKFPKLPPLKYTVKVTEHSNSVIYNYFQLKGGVTVDLTDLSDTTDFIYYSAPEIEIMPLPANDCGVPMLEQDGKYTTEITVYQPYDGGRCYLDTAMIRIDNGIEEKAAFDTLMTEGKLKYKFQAGFPNIVPPFTKTITILAKANAFENTKTTSAVVLGKRPRQVNFTSTSPQIPLMILRDPPGDASSASIESGKTVCNGWSITSSAAVMASIGLEVDLGNKQQIIAGTPAVGTITEIGVENSLEVSATVKTASSVNKSAEVCLTTTETISTSDGDVITGKDADVYVGGALNLLFGITDYLKLDTNDCTQFILDTSLLVFPDKFATTFLYTQYQIEHVVIPNLLLVNDTVSANAWRGIIQRNDDLKKSAVFEKNLSFDAGVTYENSSTIENTSSQTFGFEVEIGASVAAELGFEIAGAGSTFKMGLELSYGENTEFSTTQTNSQTVTYTLADDDIGDNFTVDVLQDKVYGTPVFKTVSGNSSCPHEPNTVPRDEVALEVDKTIAANVPMNAEAVFKFNLGNISQTQEAREYLFSLIPESNTQGAVVKIQGGSPLDRPFQIPYGSPQEVTVTIARGPVDFDYENLEFAIFPACEDEKGIALGLTAIDPKFYKSKLLSVHFLEPCSPIDIGFPLQNWVWTVADGDSLFITLNEFDRTDPDLELIRVQYRRKNGDGAWINIAEVPKSQLNNDIFKIVKWGTNDLKDGEYEIRAVTQCFGGQNAGISHVISGRFEREPPALFGTPQPADGVLSKGDEISIQFTEPIRCDQIIQADVFSNNNIGLYNTETGDLIDATISCQGDKIIIVPNVPNRFIENKILRVEVDNIKDLAGNLFVHKSWEFVVDRNPVHWEGGKVKVTKYKEETVTVTRRIVNEGGQASDFLIEGVPSWVQVYPLGGMLLPGASEEITFVFNDQMAYGSFADTISIDPAEGLEPLIVNCRVMCESPEWGFDAPAYSQTMNFAVKLNIEGTLSTDEEDIVAAFIDGEVRGTAKVQLLPTLPPLGTQYMAFLTVYGNDDDFNKPVHLEIWDASECLRFGQVTELFNFEADNVIGTVGTPQVIHTNSLVRRDIPINNGWNWLSFNLDFPNPALNQSLVSLVHPENDLIKSQSGFAEYFGSSWLGSLTQLNNTGMFQFRADTPDTIQMIGTLIDPDSLSIPITSGWNWIGYVPNYPLPVSQALAGLTALNGDIIKGQTAFAQYLAGFGWLGSLQYLEAPKGYQLKISYPGTLTYPHPTQLGGQIIDARGLPNRVEQHWNIDPSTFEYSMTLVGMLQVDDHNGTLEQHELGVFAGNALRGSATAIYVEPLHAYMFFLTIYSNTPGELLRFKLYNSASGQESNLVEQMYFSDNNHQGSIESPYPFTLESSGLNELSSLTYFDVQPNPFSNTLSIRFQSEKAQEIRVVITDATGRTVWQQKTNATAGLNKLQWNAEPGSAGLYFVRLEGETGTAIRKVVRQ
jgi:hypothetical protein